MEVKISGFASEGNIPSKYTCDGDNASPGIEIKDENKTGFYAIVLNDPDAPSGLFTHWIIYNLPAGNNAIKGGQKRLEVTGDGYYQGINDFKKIGYDGPCPPSGVHRYFFMVYRLSEPVNKKAIRPDEIYKLLKGKKAEFSIYALYKRVRI
ncbi:MAG: YbhB/YbcL family Raf kinase inhibitor-like protein [Ferroplasma sp.]